MGHRLYRSNLFLTNNVIFLVLSRQYRKLFFKSAPTPVLPNNGPFFPTPGFTLIELLVVIFLLSLMAFFSAPRLTGFFSEDDRGSISRWVITQTASMRVKALQEHQPYVLQVDVSGDAFRTIPPAPPDSLSGADQDESPDGVLSSFEETAAATGETEGAASQAAPSKELLLSDDVDIMDVLFPGDVPISSGSVEIRFYGQGYADRALIHFRAGDDRFTLYVAPFLPQVKIFDGYVDFDKEAGR